MGGVKVVYQDHVVPNLFVLAIEVVQVFPSFSFLCNCSIPDISIIVGHVVFHYLADLSQDEVGRDVLRAMQDLSKECEINGVSHLDVQAVCISLHYGRIVFHMHGEVHGDSHVPGQFF